jgi:uncharacterized protein
MTYLAFVVLGLCVGAVSGLIGIGGGILFIPALVFIFAYSQQEAQGTALATLVPPIGLLAAWQYYKQGYVHIAPAAVLACSFAVGSYISAGYIKSIPTHTLQLLFGSILIVIGCRLIFSGLPLASWALSTLIVVSLSAVSAFLLNLLGRSLATRISLTDAARKTLAHRAPAPVDWQI